MSKLQICAKNLTILLIALFIISTPLKARAQDDSSSDAETMIAPPTSSGSSIPSTIIDESDSNTLGDIEEFDG